MPITVQIKNEKVVSSNLERIKTIITKNNGAEEFSGQVLARTEKSPDRKSKLDSVTRVTEEFINISLGQSAPRARQSLRPKYTQPAKVLLEAGKLADELMAKETPGKASSARCALREAVFQEEREMKESSTLTEVITPAIVPSIHKLDSNYSSDTYRRGEVGFIATTEPTINSKTRGTASSDLAKDSSEKPILPYLRMSYLMAEVAVDTAQTLRMFHVVGIHITKQCINLVTLLNQSVTESAIWAPLIKPLTDDENLQSSELTALKKAMKKWGAEDGAVDERVERVEEIRRQYDIFFGERFYHPDARNYQLLSTLLACDDRAMEHYRQTQSHAAEPSPTSASQARSTGENFDLLIYILVNLHRQGNTRPYASIVDTEMSPHGIYKRAGFSGFKEYVRHAEKMGIVRLGGGFDGPGKGWIELTATD